MGKGRHPALKPIGRDKGPGGEDFADNDLRYEGEGRSDRFTAPLDALLSSWMAGEGLTGDLRKDFPFKVSAPTVKADVVVRLLDDYARSRDAACDAPLPSAGTAASGGKSGQSRAVFLGGEPVPEKGADGGSRLTWRWRMETHTLDMEPRYSAAEPLIDALADASAVGGMVAEDLAARISAVLDADQALRVWHTLRRAGLVLVP